MSETVAYLCVLGISVVLTLVVVVWAVGKLSGKHRFDL